MKCIKCNYEHDPKGKFESVFYMFDNQPHCRSCTIPVLGLRIQSLESALREFCDRCERGEIKSVRTYNKFKQLLEDKQ